MGCELYLNKAVKFFFFFFVVEMVGLVTWLDEN